MTAEPLVLAVDDEPGMLKLVSMELSEEGFRVITAASGDQALSLVQEQRPDVVLLDILLPDIPGLELMRKIRERFDIPVLLLTAKDSDADKVRGLEMGGDDYVVKPFSPDELAARIRAVLRRASGARPAQRVIVAGDDVEIDLERRLVSRRGQLVDLTRTEWLLLEQLGANPGKVMLSRELLAKVWGPEYVDDVQYLRVWVSRLRRKLEDDPSDPQVITTMQGIGYRLDAEPRQAVEPASGG